MHMRNTLIMAVILVLLGGFVYFFEIRGRAEREEAEHQAELLVAFEPEHVVGLTLDNDGNTIVASKSDGHWSIDEPRPVAADDEALDSLVDGLHTATHERLINEQPDDLSAFGLADPATRVTVRLDDGNEVSLAVGKDTPVGYNLYVLTADGKVYSAARGLRTKLAKSLLDLRDRSILTFDAAAVRRLRLQAPTFTAGLRREDADGDKGGSWNLTEPMQTRADDDTVEDLLDELGTDDAAAFVLDETPNDEQLADYGLSSPHASVTLWTADDASQRLIVGNESEDPEGRYAMREGGSSVFVVPTDLLDALPADVDALRNRQVLTVGRERIRGLELRGDETRRLERDGSDWKITAPRPLEADASEVSRLLSSLTGLRAEGFATEPPSDADLTVVLDLSPAEGAEDGSGESGESLEITVGATTRTVPAADSDDEDATVATRRVQVTGDPTVYLVPEDDLDDLNADTFTLRDKTLVEFTQPDLTTIEVTTADGATHRFDKSGDAWTVSAGGAEVGNKADDLLWDLNYLRMEAVAAEWPSGQEPDLAPYGLDHPRYLVVASTADGVVADVSIGADAPAAGDDDNERRVYVRVAGHDGVYEVRGALADGVAALLGATATP